MTDSLVRAQSPLEYFKEEVEAACTRLHLRPQPMTAYYVVSLLAEFADPRAASSEVMASDEPLAVRFARAVHSAGSTQRRGLKQIGDVSLFVSGFFPDSLRRSLVDVDYYVSLGGYAYGSLGASDDARSAIFAELAEKFVEFVDVLSDISERASLTSDGDLLRLYEKWVRTGSARTGERLVERGILPNASIIQGSRRVQ